MKRAKGDYWILLSGRADDRVSISLKYCSEEDAQSALRIVQDDARQTADTPNHGRIVRLARHDPEAAAAYLLGDPGALDVFANIPEDPSRLCLAEYVEKHYGPHRAERRPKTWRTEQHDWKRINQHLGSLQLRKVDEYVVDEFLQGASKLTGEPASYNMKRKYRNAIRACLTFARRRRHIEGALPEFFRLEGSNERTFEEPVPYSDQEVLALIDAASNQRYRALFAVSIVMGLRPSEAVGLDWRDVDWDFKGPLGPDGKPVFIGTVRIRDGKTRASAAAVPLLGLAQRELRAWFEEQGKPSDGIVFPRNDKGEAYASAGGNSTFRSALTRAAKRAGIERRVYPYLARHTAATKLVEAGVPISTVAKLLRHTNPRMLEKHYDHTGAVHAPGLHLAPKYESED